MNYQNVWNYLSMETSCIDFDKEVIHSRSGILVLINDTDWEVLEKEQTVLEVVLLIVYQV